MGRLRKLVSILVITAMILPYGTLAAGAKNDISNHWAKEEIEYLLGENIVSGYADGTFRPDQRITRAEFIKIINSVFGYSEIEQVQFADVKKGDWFYDEIGKAVAAGYIGGYTDGTMRPNNPISRQEVSKIMGVVFGLDETKSKSANSFVDSYLIGDWAKGYVSIMKDKGYISGYPDGTFRPTSPITRAEAVKIITNASGNIINAPGQYSEDADGNVLVNTPNVVLKDMDINGDLYLTEGIGDGDVVLDNVRVYGETHIRGGGEHSITIRNSSLGQVVVKKENSKIRVVIDENTEVSDIVVDENIILVIKEGAKVESIRVTGEANIEVEKGAGVGTIEVEAKNVEIKAEGKIDSIVAEEDVKVNGKVVEEGKEVKVENGKVEEVKEEEERPKPGTGGGGGGGDDGGSTEPEPEEPEEPDTKAPVFDYEGQKEIIVEYEAEFTVPEVSATDNVDGKVSVSVVITDAQGNEIEEIDTTVPGTYRITYTAVDRAGNRAELVLTVVVKEAPVKNETQNKYYRTIQAAIDEADEGDIIRVGEGTYSEEIHIERPIQLIGAGIDKTVLNAKDENSSHIIWLGSAREYGKDLSGTVIEGFTINSPNKAVKDISSIYLTGKGSEENKIIIKNNKFIGQEGENNQGIAVLTPYSPEIKYINIENNQITNMKYGMYFNSIRNAEIKGNTIDGTRYAGIVFFGKLEYPCSEIVVSNNTLTNIAYEEDDFHDIYYAGIGFYHYDTSNITLENNEVIMLNGRPDIYFKELINLNWTVDGKEIGETVSVVNPFNIEVTATHEEDKPIKNVRYVLEITEPTDGSIQTIKVDGKNLDEVANGLWYYTPSNGIESGVPVIFTVEGTPGIYNIKIYVEIILD